MSEFPIVSSSSSTLEEPVWVSEEPNEYKAKKNEVTTTRLTQY